MRIQEWFSPPDPCRPYDSHERLFRGLQRLENAAILCLQMKALKPVRKIVRQYGLPPDQADDILNRSTLIFLQKIEDGNYQFLGHAPSTYLIEIARRVTLSATRAQKKTTAPLDGHERLPDPEVESDKRRQEDTELVRHLLDRLGDPCAQVIRLHHIEGYSDEDVVQQNMTRYTTVDSLKMKRSDCMKKLIQLARKWKISNNT